MVSSMACLLDYLTNITFVSLLHMTDINTIIQFVLNTPEHVLVNTSNSCRDTLLEIIYTYKKWRNKICI
jgi:hypothetical protein